MVIAESYERIHRSNLVGMGILPLQFNAGDSAASLGLTGRERLTVSGLEDGPTPKQTVTVTATADDGTERRFSAIARLDGPIDVEYYHGGGILPTVLRRLAAEGPGGGARDSELRIAARGRCRRRRRRAPE